jgi:DNA-binding MarR family transcriptional regulator
MYQPDYDSSMPAGPRWLDVREDRAWRSFVHAHHGLEARLQRHLLQDSRLTAADYEVLAVLSEHPRGRMPAGQLCALLVWEKSRLSHQVRRMEERALVARDPNPEDARSVVIRLLPAGRRAVKRAAPQHVEHVREHFIELFTPSELETLTALNERVMRHLAERPLAEESAPDER